jgi:hypothetical protein
MTSIFRSFAMGTNHLHLNTQNPPPPDAIYNCDDNRADSTGTSDIGKRLPGDPANQKKRTQSTSRKSIYINGRTQQVIENTSTRIKNEATNSRPVFSTKRTQFLRSQIPSARRPNFMLQLDLNIKNHG